MTTTREMGFHGRTRNVGCRASTTQPWKTKPVFWFGSLWPCAVMLPAWPGDSVATSLHWRTALPLPKTKSTVPETRQSR